MLNLKLAKVQLSQLILIKMDNLVNELMNELGLGRTKSKENNVLIIDDDPGVREVLEETFKQGYTTIAVATGEDALKYIDNIDKAVKVVILDIKLPKMDGKQIYNEIKKRIDVPIIFHTAYPGEEEQQCLELNPFAYIYKGTDRSYDNLLDAVERALK